MRIKKIVCIFLIQGVFSGLLFAWEQSRLSDNQRIELPLLQVDSTLVDMSANWISGNRTALDPLFEKLRLIRNGKEDVVSILQIGDSHVQAGFYPDIVRSRLQECFGNAGRGLVAPLRLMGINEPSGYAITSKNSWLSAKCVDLKPDFQVGVSGVAIASPDSEVQFTIRSTDGPFDRIVAFHHAEAPLLQVTGDLATELSCPAENTDISTVIPLSRSVDSVTLSGPIVDSLFAMPLFYGFSLENGNKGLLYHYAGVNGCTYEHITRNPQMVEQAALLSPDLIIISLGTNDSFGRNFGPDYISEKIAAVIELCRRYHPEAILLLTTPMECYSSGRVNRKWTLRANPNISKVHECIVQSAEKYSLPYWDFYAVTRDAGGMKRWGTAGLAAKDRVHLTKEGYQLQGELLFRALADAYNVYLNR